MIPLLAAALEVHTFLDEQGWPFCLIGGLAVVRWGEPRTTQDVDVTLLTGFGSEESFVDPILARFRSRRSDARDFALLRRVLLVESTNGRGVDISLGGLPFERDVVRRASHYTFARGCRLRTCSAEDLVVMKAFAGRMQDWRDVQTVLLRQAGRLDLAYIRRQLAPLVELKEQPEILDRLEAMFREEGLA
jgi:predicted nucleotidyltransferase